MRMHIHTNDNYITYSVKQGQWKAKRAIVAPAESDLAFTKAKSIYIQKMCISIYTRYI